MLTCTYTLLRSNETVFRDLTEYYEKVNKSNEVDINYDLHGYGHDFTEESGELANRWLKKGSLVIK